MPKIIKTKLCIGAENIQQRLRIDEPGTKAKIGITRKLIVTPRWDIRVHFVTRRNHVKIFATHPLVVALLYGGDRFGFASDEKRHFENRYAEWFEQKFRPLIFDGNNGAEPQHRATK
jgi:hypothetical protein